MSGRRASEDPDSVFTNQQGSRLGSGDVSISQVMLQFKEIVQTLLTNHMLQT